ncbi:hypothetical protein QWI17_02160 [Gilvimarinus sp. SDUM040013]|uniref:Uncharacterized protein n=1 Tax=Gilvimarinus gilvus TaxID=3058038 RepID=A0ABU4S139_9GAMM|nr:hypothetical protein [Gilvimarinus sp. SDUM040013]MDO3384635.1 hypothetical protein [Gilvimarinus sp. SDUM040013]MDX6850221.1 hypothetical protein [Gilvimarinus sp. SDUM040013]
MYKVTSIVAATLVLVSCHPRPTYEHISLQPDIRQQVFTLRVGSQSGLICNAFDGIPLSYFTYDDLPGDSAEVGYVSHDNDGQRPRCRRDRNWEFHVLLSFDLSELQTNPPEGSLYQVTLSGLDTGHTENSGCELTRDTLVDSVIVDWSPLPTEATLDSDVAVEITELNIDGEELNLRERTDLLGDGHTEARLGSGPNFVFPWTASSVDNLSLRLASGAGTGGPEYPVLVLGKANPGWKSDRQCFTTLSELRLNLIYRSE